MQGGSPAHQLSHETEEKKNEEFDTKHCDVFGGTASRNGFLEFDYLELLTNAYTRTFKSGWYVREFESIFVFTSSEI